MEDARKPRGFFVQVMLAVILSLIITFVLIIGVAFIVKAANLSDSWLIPINVIIKAVSLLLGCLFGIRDSERGWQKGLLIGLLFTALSFLIFSLVDGAFDFSVSLLWDILIGAAMGLISGIISVNVRKK